MCARSFVYEKSYTPIRDVRDFFWIKAISFQLKTRCIK